MTNKILTMNNLKTVTGFMRTHLNYNYKRYIKKANKLIDFNIKPTKYIVNSYNGDDWLEYKEIIDQNPEKYKAHRTLDYYKIKIPYTNEDDIFDIYLIKWDPKSTTHVHNHTEYGCIMKVLDGEIREEHFDIFFEKSVFHRNFGPFIYKKDSVGYIDNKIARHRIWNPSHQDDAYSLHVYGFPAILRNYSYYTPNNDN